MKENTFYRSMMDQGGWHVYIFKPSWTHNHFGKWGESDLPGYINSINHESIFRRAEEIDGTEDCLYNLKRFIMRELFEEKNHA